ncbi:MAG: AsmA-like C-terminal domain-containing protein [Candidatus Tectomicrobia bacterium]|nr:AsmA-like C-terminal domain-containing protein [Candidatus Tectomicrobia bacterium]
MLLALGAVLALGLIAAWVVLPTLLDLNTYKSYLVAQLEKSFNLKVELGDVSLSYDTGMAVRFRDVRLSLPGAEAPFLRMSELRLGIKPRPLLHGEFVFTRVSLVKPEMHLARLADGRWSLGPPGIVEGQRTSPAPAAPADQSPTSTTGTAPPPAAPAAVLQNLGGWLTALHLGELRVHKGNLTFTDRRDSREPRDVRLADLELALSGVTPGESPPSGTKHPRLRLRGTLEAGAQHSPLTLDLALRPDGDSPTRANAAPAGAPPPSPGALPASPPEAAAGAAPDAAPPASPAAAWLADLNAALGGRFDLARAELSAELEVGNFSLSRFAPYWEPLLPQGLPSSFATGTVTLQAKFAGRPLNRFTSSLAVTAGPLRLQHPGWFRGPLSFPRAALTLRLEREGATLRLSDARLDLQHLRIEAKARLEEFASSQRRLDATLRIPTLDLAELKQLLPVRLMPAKLVDDLDNDLKAGTVAIEELHLRGQPAALFGKMELRNPEQFQARARLTNVSLISGEERVPVDALTGELRIEGDTLRFAEVTARIGDLRLTQLQGTVWQLFSKPLLRLSTRADVDLQELRELFRSKHKSPKVRAFVETLRDLKGRSILELKAMKRLGVDTPWVFEGRGPLTNASLFQVTLNQPIEHLSGEIRFHNDFVATSALRAHLGGIPLEMQGSYGKFLTSPSPLSQAPAAPGLDWFLALRQELEGPSVFDLQLSTSMTLPDALRLSRSRHVPAAVRREAATINQATGGLTLALQVRKVLAPKEVVVVHGTGRFVDLGGKYPRLKLPLATLSGAFEFSNAALTLTGVTGAFGSTAFTARGRYAGPWELYLQAPLHLGDVLALLPGDTAPPLTMTGRPDLRLQLRGQGTSVRVESAVDLKNVGYTFSTWMRKEAGVANRLELEGQITAGESAVLKSLRFRTMSGILSGSGVISTFHPLALRLRLHTDGWRFDELLPFLQGSHAYRAAGMVSGSVLVERSPPQHQAPRTPSLPTPPGHSPQDASLRFESTVVVPRGRLVQQPERPGEEPRPIDFELAATLSNNELRLSNLHVLVGGTELRLSGTLPGYRTPSPSVNYQRVRAVIDELLPPPRAKSKYLRAEISLVKRHARRLERSYWMILPEAWKLRGSLRVQQGEIKRYVFQNLTGALEVRGGDLHLANLTAAFYGGTFAGSSILHLQKRAEQTFEVDLNLSDVSSEALLEDVWMRGDVLQGRLAAQGKLAGRFTIEGSATRTLNGELTLTATNGHIQRYSTIGKILSLLNLWQLLEGKTPALAARGLPYERLGGSFTLREGVAETTTVALESAAAKATAVGSVNLDTLDLRLDVGVQWLQTVDKIISKLPILGHILTGDNRRLLVSYFRVEGSLQNPKVTPTPFEHLGRGVLNIFKRFFQLPSRLLPQNN